MSLHESNDNDEAEQPIATHRGSLQPPGDGYKTLDEIDSNAVALILSECAASAYIARNRMKAAPMTASEQTITKYSRSNRITKSLLRQNLAVRLPTTANFVSPTRANSLFSRAIAARARPAARLLVADTSSTAARSRLARPARGQASCRNGYQITRAFILARAPQPFLSLGRIFASLCMSERPIRNSG
jgi:hypothetical protein